MKILLVLILLVGLFMSHFVAVVSDLRQDDINFRGTRSTESSSYFFYQQPEYPRDCEEVYDQCEGQSANGVFVIKPEGSPEPFEVYCNNSIDGGGWTVIQRRLDGSVDFYRDWKEYKNGFGFLRGDFWLGNDKISDLTNQKIYELRIDLNNVYEEPYFAKYNFFRLSDEGSNYRLVGIGGYNSTSTANFDALGSGYHRNRSFSTRDRDNSNGSSHGATYAHGAWWFSTNYVSNLNGLFNPGSTAFKGMRWYNLPGDQFNIKYSEMKIRSLPGS